MSAEVVYMVILLLFPRMSHDNRRCVENTRDQIIQQLREVEEMGVPPSVMAAVAFRETHLGCDRNEGGNWGAPISPTRRHTAGTHIHAARAMLTSYRVCGGGWESAITRFHSGICEARRTARGRGYRDATVGLLHRMWDYGFPVRRWE